MPPRHGKSELVSRRFPAWLLGLNPNAQIIACSYSATLASRMNRDVQRVIDSEIYKLIYPKTKLWSKATRAESNAEGTWQRTTEEFEVVDYRGYYKSAGVGGGITGRGFQWGIIDDPIKDQKEASSPVAQEALWEWYNAVFETRAEKDAARIICMTRWSPTDLVGRLLERNPEGWVRLSLPAIAEGDLAAEDPREVGEALWPDKYPLAVLEEKRATMPASQFEALYQQRPYVKGGGTFRTEWIKPEHWLNVAPTGMRTLWYWDNAGTDGGGARTAGALMGEKDGVYYVLRIVTGQWSAQKREAQKRAMAEWAKAAYGTTTVWSEQEPGSGGKEQFEATVRHLAGFVVKADKVTGSKELRAEPFASQMEAGNVRIVTGDHGEWVRGFLDELESFPKGRYKDQVDAAAGAFARLADRDKGTRIEWLT